MSDDDLRSELARLAGQQVSHEAVCAERYDRIGSALDRLDEEHKATRAELLSGQKELFRRWFWGACVLAGFLLTVSGFLLKQTVFS